VMESNQRVNGHDYNIDDDYEDHGENDEAEEGGPIAAVARINNDFDNSNADANHNDFDNSGSTINQSHLPPEHQLSIVPAFIDSFLGITIPAVEIQGSITPVTQNG